MKSAAQALLALLVVALVAIGLKATWQAGYDAHQKLSDAESASTLAANTNVAQRASQTLSFDLGAVSAFDAEASKTLLEIEGYETNSSSDTCGVPVDWVRQLEKFN